MPTAAPTRKRKKAGQARKATPKKKAAKPAAKGKIAGTGDDPRQQYLGDTKPLTVPRIDSLVARHSDLTTSRKSAKDTADEVLDEIVKLMKENDIKLYRSNGKMVTVQEGQTVVRIKKASDR